MALIPMNVEQLRREGIKNNQKKEMKKKHLKHKYRHYQNIMSVDYTI